MRRKFYYKLRHIIQLNERLFQRFQWFSREEWEKITKLTDKYLIHSLSHTYTNTILTQNMNIDMYIFTVSSKLIMSLTEHFCTKYLIDILFEYVVLFIIGNFCVFTSYCCVFLFISLFNREFGWIFFCFVWLSSHIHTHSVHFLFLSFYFALTSFLIVSLQLLHICRVILHLLLFLYVCVCFGSYFQNRNLTITSTKTNSILNNLSSQR